MSDPNRGTTNPDNDAPYTGFDYIETDCDVPITFTQADLVTNDTDFDGDTLRVTGIHEQPENGTVVINEDGTLTFTPDEGFYGYTTFCYIVEDGNGGWAYGEVGFNVRKTDKENYAPEARDDVAILIPEDDEVEIDVLDNDVDEDSDELSIISVTQPPEGQGTVEIVNGRIVYTRGDDDSVEEVTFTYTISDGRGGTDTATVTVEVQTEENNPPDALDDEAETPQGTPVTIDVLANDSDPEGTELTIIDVEQPAEGTVEIVNNQLVYTPADGQAPGDVTFFYHVQDEDGEEATAQVTVTVTEGSSENNDPDAVNDDRTTEVNTPIEINVLGNDTDPDDDTLTVISTTNGLNGTVEINADGTVTYTPETGFIGSDTFTYTISDGNGGEDTATVTVWVEKPANEAPDAVDDAQSTAFGTPVQIDVLGNDTDPDGDDLTVTNVTDGANGTVVINADGTVTYTPNDGFSGEDTFTYTISDGNGGEDTATVTVTVADQPAGTARVGNRIWFDADGDGIQDRAELRSRHEFLEDIEVRLLDTDGNIVATTFTTNRAGSYQFTEVDAGRYQIQVVAPEGFAFTEQFAGTRRGRDSNIDPETGLSNLFTITDGQIQRSIDVGLVRIDMNDNPDAVDDAETTGFEMPVQINVLGNDTDPDNDDLTVTEVTNGANGTVVINADGTVTYTPNDGFTGEDTFTYTISDGNGGEDTATVTVTVEAAANNAPDAIDDVETTGFETPVQIDVLGNDTDPDNDDLTVTEVTDGANGTVVINADGTVTYTPNDGFSGEDTFTYTISDGNGGEDTATVTVTVEPAQNQAPDAVDDARSLFPGETETINVLANDSDANGDDLTITAIIDPANPAMQLPISEGGSVTLQSGTIVRLVDGELQVTRADDADPAVNETFSYVITDGEEDATARVTLTADTDGDGVNDADDIDDDNDGIIDTLEMSGLGELETENVTSIEEWEGLGVTIGGADASTNNTLEVGQGYTTTDTYTGITFNYSRTLGTVAQTDEPVEVPLNVGEREHAVSVEFEAYQNWPGYAGQAAALFELVDENGTVLDSVSWSAASDGQTSTLNLSAQGTGVFLRVTDQSTHASSWGDDWTLRNLSIERQAANTFVDSDGDGILDHLDIDDDNDGITSNVEAQGTADYIAPSGVDSDGNGLDDAYESVPGAGEGLQPVDTDGDGTTDHLDRDSDDDGRSDVAENGRGVTQAQIDASGDADGDGLADIVEGADIADGFDVNDENYVDGEFTLPADPDLNPDGSNAGPGVDLLFREGADTDGDRVEDRDDIDDDNDGILDVYEMARGEKLSTETVNTAAQWEALGVTVDGQDANSDTEVMVGNGYSTYDPYIGITFNYTQAEGTNTETDGLVEVPLGVNEGVSDLGISFAAYANWPTYNGNAAALFELVDAQGNVLDSAEWSAFDDGQEAEFSLEGRGDGLFLRITDQSDHANSWGDDWTFRNLEIHEYELVDRDTDGDGIVDRIDLDSDNDGITDNVEGQPTQSFEELSGTDADGNGLDDIYETAPGRGDARAPVDTDGDGIADFIDLNSDGDDFTDREENGQNVSQAEIDASGDADQDGLLDVFEGSDINDGYEDTNDENFENGEFTLPGDPRLNPDGSNADPDGNPPIDLEFREFDRTLAENGAPEAEDDEVILPRDADDIVINVLENDIDPDGDDLTVTIIQQPTHGTVRVNADGTVTYVPGDTFTTEDEFFYRISDGNGGFDEARVVVLDDNDPPVANNDHLQIQFYPNDGGASQSINVVTGVGDIRGNGAGADFDPDGDTLRVIEFDQPNNGSLTLSSDGQTFTYSTPHVGFGVEFINYTISDGRGGTASAVLRIDWTCHGSPIAIDLNRDGEIGVTGETSSQDKTGVEEIGRTVEFDIDGDGDLDVIEWFDGSGDGILVDNRDGNAATDMNGSRLFGDEGGQYANGYEKLAELDTNGDGQLTGEELEGLQFWIDDGDAIVEEGELQSLADHNIASISTDMQIGFDDQGRELMQSSATTTDGEELLSEDVWFGIGGAEDAKEIEADEAVTYCDKQAETCELTTSDTI
jgi:hypothetical protein